MNAAFLLLTSACLAGADPVAAPVIAPAAGACCGSCGTTSCCDTCCEPCCPKEHWWSRFTHKKCCDDCCAPVTCTTCCPPPCCTTCCPTPCCAPKCCEPKCCAPKCCDCCDPCCCKESWFDKLKARFHHKCCDCCEPCCDTCTTCGCGAPAAAMPAPVGKTPEMIAPPKGEGKKAPEEESARPLVPGPVAPTRTSEIPF